MGARAAGRTKLESDEQNCHNVKTQLRGATDVARRGGLMIETIWVALEPYLSEIFKRGADIISKKNDWKRQSIGRFML
jgi:hypothetical protein